MLAYDVCDYVRESSTSLVPIQATDTTQGGMLFAVDCLLISRFTMSSVSVWPGQAINQPPRNPKRWGLQTRCSLCQIPQSHIGAPSFTAWTPTGRPKSCHQHAIPSSLAPGCRASRSPTIFHGIALRAVRPQWSCWKPARCAAVRPAAMAAT